MMIVTIEKYPAVLWGIFLLFSVECNNGTNPESTSTHTVTQVMFTTDKASHLGSPESIGNTTSKVDPKDQVTVTQNLFHKLTGTSVPTTKATPKKIMSFSVENGKAISSAQSPNLDPRHTTSGVISGSTTKIMVTNSSPNLDAIATVLPAMELGSDAPSTSPALTRIPETVKQTQQQSSSQESAMTSLKLPTTASTTGFVHTLQHSSTQTPNITIRLSSVIPKFTMTPTSPQGVNYSTVSPSIATISTLRGSSASEASTNSLPVNTTKTSTNNTEIISTSRRQSPSWTPTSSSMSSSSKGPNSTTEFPSTNQTLSTTSNISTTAVSTNSTAGVFIPQVPRRLPFFTTKPTQATLTATFKNVAHGSGVQPCFSKKNGLINKCLIAIASLAGLATLFMVATVILCAKLSSQKHSYQVKKDQQGTEMVCISALLPDRNFSYERQHNPKTRGALLPSSKWDSDEEGSDNLTLNSFLPENDNFV
ncbi:P-selectin glycoprotein ligand 1 [Lampris incognitus]|uniref:P-selectin glycoprotein ligand 1 n=1 Tax=Lampris incognitus TaxID=2546036 RepID=UPI0024B6159E|nr:P-selectin glycoprotein ligand 1 [Lampris incognitus]